MATSSKRAYATPRSAAPRDTAPVAGHCWPIPPQETLRHCSGWYTHLNAEFQRIARRDKKAFLSNQCKEIEENSRMEKTRDLFKKIRDTKGTFHAKMGTIKDRNGMDLTEAEDIKKRWQEYTELYKRDLHDPDNHNGVITHLEWSWNQSQVGLSKYHYEQSYGVMGFQLSYFKS